MANKPTAENPKYIPLILREKTHDLILYTYTVMHHAPKFEKFTSQTQAKNLVFDFCKAVIRAQKSTTRRSHLYEADVLLEQFREIITIMHELGYINSHHFETLSAKTNEVGRILGGLIAAELARDKK